MTLRYEFVLPINLILVLVLGASLAWEYRRQETAGMAVLKARIGEEARFIQAAYQSMGITPRFAGFLESFCHATDAVTSPEHQVAVVDRTGKVLKSTCVHGRPSLDPERLAALGEGFWLRRTGEESYLVRVTDDGSRRVVVAESTRALRDQIRASLRAHAGWYLGLGIMVLTALNVLIRRVVLRPIRHLYRAVRQMEQGRLGIVVEVPGNDELAILGHQFNAMSRTIADQVEAHRRELETARRVQEHLLPPSEVHIGGLEIAGRCLQRGPVGGDLYDVQPLSGDRVGLLLADLSGHNVAAALHTAMLRSIAWREAENASSPAEVLNRLNDRLCRDLPEEHFATVFFAWFDPRSGRLHYANAGHPPAYFRPPTGSIRELEFTGPLLGIIPGASYDSAEVEIRPGSRLLLYSDGLSETQDLHGRLWGTADLLSLLRSPRDESPAQLLERILERVDEYRGDCPRQDDVTVVIAGLDPS